MKHASNRENIPEYFFRYLQGQCEPDTAIVLKAADQIMALDKLQLPCSDQMLRTIARETSFSATTGGRTAGQSAQHVLRRGAIGEWKTTFTPEEARRACKMAGAELSRFGYSENSEYVDRISGLLSTN